MKTMILKAAALTGLAALIPATVALSAYASEVKPAEPAETVPAETEEAIPDSAETVITETDDGQIEITKTPSVTDDGTESDEEETVYCYCDDEDGTVVVNGTVQAGDAEGLAFLIGSSEADLTTLPQEKADALAQEKLTAEEYARWQELTAQVQGTDFVTENGAETNELTELLAKITEGEGEWYGFSYTESVNEDGTDTVGYCTITDGEDDGIVNTEETVYSYAEEITE